MLRKSYFSLFNLIDISENINNKILIFVYKNQIRYCLKKELEIKIYTEQEKKKQMHKCPLNFLISEKYFFKYKFSTFYYKNCYTIEQFNNFSSLKK